MVRHYKAGRYFKKNGIHVLHLQGDYAAMAEQHGALLANEIKSGVVKYLSDKNFKLVDHAYWFQTRPRLANLIKKILYITLHKPIQAHMPSVYVDEMRALAKASGLDMSTLLKLEVHADELNLMMHYLLPKIAFSSISPGIPACTSVVVLPKRSTNGSVLHARNLDYPAVGRWERQPTVIYSDPHQLCRSMRTVSISTAGLHTQGVTSMNEAGLCLSTHFHLSKQVGPFGMPVHCLGSEIIRKARTIAQAIDIVKSHRVAGAWSFVVSSAQERDAVIIETNNQRTAVVVADSSGVVTHANAYQTAELQEHEYALSKVLRDDFAHRRARAFHLISDLKGSVAVEDLMALLADRFDSGTQSIRPLPNTIGVVTTVTSLVASLGSGEFYISNAPTTPTSDGDWVRFNLNETFRADFSENALSQVNQSDLQHRFRIAAQFLSNAQTVGFSWYRKAYEEFHTNYSRIGALLCLERAVASSPDEALYRLALGHFLLLDHRVENALREFQLAQTFSIGQAHREAAMLREAHCLDLLGRRIQALKLYQTLLSAADAKVVREALCCKDTPYTFDRIQKITFDLQFCDALEYA